MGTIAHYAVLVIFVESFHVNPVTGSALGFAIGAIVNYFLNYKITFASSRRHTEALPRFFLIAVLGMVINTTTMSILLRVTTLHYILVQLVATGISLVGNFLGNKLWTFQE